MSRGQTGGRRRGSRRASAATKCADLIERARASMFDDRARALRSLDDALLLSPEASDIAMICSLRVIAEGGQGAATDIGESPGATADGGRGEGEYLLARAILSLRSRSPDAARSDATKAAGAFRRCRDHAWEAASWLKVAAAHTSDNDAPAALAATGRALRAAERAGHTHLIAECHEAIGWGSYCVGNVADAILGLDRAMELTEDAGASAVRARALYHLGCIRCDFGDFDESLALFLRGLEIGRDADNAMEALILTGCGVVHRRSGDAAEALRYFEAALQSARSTGNRYHEATTLGSIGNVHLGAGRWEEAELCYRQALNAARALGIPSLEGTMLENLARVQTGKGERDAAASAYAEARRIHEEVGFRSGVVSAMIGEGQMLLDGGRLEEAEERLAGGLREAEAIGEKELIAEAHEFLADLYRRRGDADDATRAYDHLLQGTRVRSDLAAAEKQRAIARLQARHELDALERERARLRQENDRLQLEAERKREELNAMAVRLLQREEQIASLKEKVAAMTAEGGELTARAATMLSDEIDRVAVTQEEWRAFDERFETLHHGFMATLARRYPALSSAELKVCALLRTQLSTKEIASLLGVTTRAVEKHRYQVRRKLELDAGVSLTTWLTRVEEGTTTPPGGDDPSRLMNTTQPPPPESTDGGGGVRATS